jgi:UDP-GlcNAc:undecaprenyl-phosphate GlcNAc-1-phosphate transferase
MPTYVGAYFISAYLALLITPLVVWLARRIGAVDRPGLRSVHTQPIPRIGGVAIYVSSLGAILPLLFLDNTVGRIFHDVQLQILVLLGFASAVFLIGLIDDLRRLPARFKFVAELLAAGAVCLSGVRITTIGLGEGMTADLGWLGWPLTLLWIVGLTNAVNMSDGLDGLAAGLAAVACGVIAIFSFHGTFIHTGAVRDNDVLMGLFALALLGSLSGFLFFNFNPARVFMGDCGSLFIGFTIAAVSVMCVSKSAALVGLALPALALGIPIFDTLFSMLRRFLERRSLFAPDRSHFHHRLLELGLNQRWAVMTIYGVTLVTAGLGLFMISRSGLGSLLVFAVLLGLLVLLFRIVGVIRLQEVLRRLQGKYRYSHQVREDTRTFENLQLQFRQVRDAHQWWQAVCEAARQMDFARVSLKTTHEDGRVEEQLWHTPKIETIPPSMILVCIPVRNASKGWTTSLELAIPRNGSLEAAGRRATLFARLLDEGGATAATGGGKPCAGPVS